MAKEVMKTHDITFCDRPDVLLPTMLEISPSLHTEKFGDNYERYVL